MSHVPDYSQEIYPPSEMVPEWLYLIDKPVGNWDQSLISNSKSIIISYGWFQGVKVEAVYGLLAVRRLSLNIDVNHVQTDKLPYLPSRMSLGQDRTCGCPTEFPNFQVPTEYVSCMSCCCWLDLDHPLASPNFTIHTWGIFYDVYWRCLQSDWLAGYRCRSFRRWNR